MTTGQRLGRCRCSLRTSGATRSWERQEPPPEPSWGTSPAHTLLSDFQPPELWENKVLLGHRGSLVPGRHGSWCQGLGRTLTGSDAGGAARQEQWHEAGTAGE